MVCQKALWHCGFFNSDYNDYNNYKGLNNEQIRPINYCLSWTPSRDRHLNSHRNPPARGLKMKYFSLFGGIRGSIL